MSAKMAANEIRTYVHTNLRRTLRIEVAAILERRTGSAVVTLC